MKYEDNFNWAVKQKLMLENGRVVIVYTSSSLSDTTIVKKFENILCFDKNGEMVWKINGMEEYKYWKEDAFVGVGQLEDGTLVATDWDGFVFKVNKETGKAIFLEWVK